MPGQRTWQWVASVCLTGHMAREGEIRDRGSRSKHAPVSITNAIKKSAKVLKVTCSISVSMKRPGAQGAQGLQPAASRWSGCSGQCLWEPSWTKLAKGCLLIPPNVLSLHPGRRSSHCKADMASPLGKWGTCTSSFHRNDLMTGTFFSSQACKLRGL